MSTRPEKRHTMHSTTRIQKELRPNAKAIPSYEEQNIVKQNRKSLSTPQFNTVLRQKDEIEKIEGLKPRRYQNTGNLTPRTMATIMPKINQRLNFDVSRPVFKNLMPINVNDSVLLPTEKTSIPRKYNFSSKNKKPPVPELSDFLDPIEPLTHFIPLPELKLEFAPLTYNPMKIFERYVDNSLIEKTHSLSKE